MDARVYLLATLLVTVFLYSCGACSKKIDCPGYQDDTLDSWFPYQHNQQLIFGTTRQYDTITLQHVETTAPYQATTSGIFSPLYCTAQKRFQSQEVDTLKQRKATITLSTDGGSRQVYFSYGNRTFGIQNLQANGLGQVFGSGRNMVVQRLPAVTLGNRTFSPAMEATGDTVSVKTPGLFKLYYARGEGLVGYVEFPSLKIWVKQ